ncbi:MAG: hypothetical protein CMG71_06910 [Candidatus Marinimicrobia bacterium]|nr:hypothetical protein [Candidatus Neomarinimicrobiota bacterium]|tara:strand:- start:4333 stop:6945 length:2613 start_codon:yes stop_codon:yes gene_type:complete
MKKVIGIILTLSISLTIGADNHKLGRVQKFTPSNHDHWMQMRKAARTGELPAFLRESSRQLNREKARISGRVEESKRQLNRASSDSDLIGRWEETSSSEQFTLTVGSDQEIPNPLHVFGIEESKGAITFEDNSGSVEATYLPTGFAPLLTTVSLESLDEDPDFPIVQLSWLYMENMDDYVSHPDSISLAVLHDSVSYSFGTAGGELMDNVTIYAGDILYDEKPEYDLPMVRIVHGITIKDTISVELIDLMGNSSTLTVTGEIKHGTIPLMAGVQYPVEDPFGSLWDGDEEDDDWYIEKFYVEFLSDNTGRFINYWEDLEYDETYNDSSAFVWATWDDTLAITQKHEDWDEDKEEYIVITETVDVVYKVDKHNELTISHEFDFCDDEFEDPLSPYACGDSLRFFGLFGLNDVESFIISFTANHDYDGKTGARTDLVFNQIMPGDGSVIEITSGNAWADSLVFAWESADHVFGDGDVTYVTELSGDLDNFFLMTPNTTDNIWKIPYHHIKSYMDQAGLSKATGKWDIRSEGKSSGLFFDGADDYLDLANGVNTNFTTDNFAVQAWVRTTSEASQGILLKSNGDNTWSESEFHLYLDSAGFPNWAGYGRDYIQGNKSINDGKWHHVVVVWYYSGSGTTGTGKMYIDGVETTASSSYNANGNDIKENKIYIGKPNYSESKNYFLGSLKEIAIYNGRITETEVSELYNSGLGKSATTAQADSILGYWQLDEGRGSTVNSEICSCNDGTIHGASWKRVQYSANGPFELTIDATGLSVENGDFLPDQFQLHANFPNPFNPTTSIMYDLPEDASVSLMIYDITGREIRHLVNESQNAGFKAIMWDGTNNYGYPVGTGMYLYQIKAGSFVQTRKMLLMK